jgi:lipoprotein-anchoring transpeptidase ErfK/SrfK
MTWTYHQSTGQIEHDGRAVGLGYSGHGDGLNNPDMEEVHDVGPIPAGSWNIGDPEDSPKLGPEAIPLDPVGHDAHGRTGFFIHGDNMQMNHTASDGCIILARSIRDQIVNDGDRDLAVVA